jgi:benzoate membrane transport protein
MMTQLKKDFSLSAVVAGFIVLLVGITSSGVLVFQAARSFGLDAQGASSWLGSLCLGMGLVGLVLSLRYRMPVLLAWSTPGAALLAGGLAGVSLAEVTGAFLFSALLIFLSGVTGLFEKIMNRIPMGLASALLGGILLKFCLETFLCLKSQPLLVGAMLLAYLAGKKWKPRLTMLFVLLAGIITAAAIGELQFAQIELAPTTWSFVSPEWRWSVLLSVGVPLFVVTMASQNLPGFAVMRANGFHAPVSQLMSWTGVMNLLTACFGGFAINLAAITAAIAMGSESHQDRDKRYVAGVVSGVLYMLVGVMAGSVTSLFAAFPSEMVTAIAGLALLSTTANCLQSALEDARHKEAAFITFAVAASGVSLFGVGSAFWAITAGALIQFLLGERKSNGAG